MIDRISSKNFIKLSNTKSLEGLVSFFNGTSTFVGYLMPKLFS